MNGPQVTVRDLLAQCENGPVLDLDYAYLTPSSLRHRGRRS
jgi:hypothetical protein